MIKKWGCFIIGFSLLVGCGEKEKVRTLVYLRNGGDAEKKVIEPQIESFEKSHPGVKVQLIMVPWEQGQQKLITMIASDNSPDLAYIGSRYIPLFAKMDVIEPVEVSAETRNEYFPVIWKMVEWQGKIYGIPRAFSTKVLYYNTRLFEEAGVKRPPETWAELLESAKLVTQKTSAYGFALSGAKFVSTTSQFLNFLFQNGGEVISESGELVINSKRNIEALRFYSDLKKYSEPGPLAHKREDLSHLFAEGKVAMFISGPWRWERFNKAGVPFKIAPLPAGPEGKSSCVLISDAIVLFKNSKYKGLAKELIFHLTSYENQTLLDTLWGTTPMRKREAELEFFKSPGWQPFIEMILRGKPQPLVENWDRFEDLLTNAIQKVLSEKKTPESALNEMVKKWKTY